MKFWTVSDEVQYLLLLQYLVPYLMFGIDSDFEWLEYIWKFMFLISKELQTYCPIRMVYTDISTTTTETALKVL